MITLEADAGGQRLDRFLMERLDQSRNHFQRAIERGDVLINGRAAKNNCRLKSGDVITIEEAEPEPTDVEPENIPLDILYEDADIIIVNKARGMTVHPAEGIYSGTLVNALLYHCRDLSGINGVMRPGIVHRLDKDTSGVMVVAKNDRAHVDLAEQIKNKSARRVYEAIVHGVVKSDAGIINGAIGRSPLDRKKMAIVEGGKSATTEFKVLERFDRYTLVECRLKTGRTHQIRVHMTAIGHPLLGDPIYGARRNEFNMTCQALHSRELTLTHPTTGEPMKFSAPLPEDMAAILRRLRQN